MLHSQRESCFEQKRDRYPLHCSCDLLQCDTRRQFESGSSRQPLYENEGVCCTLIIQLKSSIATVKSVTCRARSKSSHRGCVGHERTNNNVLIDFWILIPRYAPPHEDTNCEPRICLKCTLIPDSLLRSTVMGSERTCKINTFLV